MRRDPRSRHGFPGATRGRGAGEVGLAVSVRRAEVRDAAAIARVHVDTWRSTYPGVVPLEYLANMSYESREHRWRGIIEDPRGKTTSFVAETESEGVVGFAACGPDRAVDPEYEGELYAIYVVRSMQRSGLGRTLVRSVVDDLRARGFDSMLAWVLEQSPSRRFYERIGGELVRSKEVEIGGKHLIEVGYGWKDLDALLENLRG